jgi:hypothetical protein
MPLGNPSITSPRMGDRTRASRVSPRDVTGRTCAQQHAELKAKQELETVDINAVKHAEFQRGFEAGHRAGWTSLTSALHNLYKAEGIQAVQEFLDELDSDEPGDAPEEAV